MYLTQPLDNFEKPTPASKCHYDTQDWSFDTLGARSRADVVRVDVHVRVVILRRPCGRRVGLVLRSFVDRATWIIETFFVGRNRRNKLHPFAEGLLTNFETKKLALLPSMQTGKAIILSYEASNTTVTMSLCSPLAWWRHFLPHLQ